MRINCIGVVGRFACLWLGCLALGAAALHAAEPKDSAPKAKQDQPATKTPEPRPVAKEAKEANAPKAEKAAKETKVSKEAASKAAKSAGKKTPPDGPAISFHREIQPIFQRHCQGCHQPAKKGGDLQMTTLEGMRKGGKNGPAYVPQQPEEGTLLASLRGEGLSLMPKGAKPLPAADIEKIERWIAQGAKDDTPPEEIDTISAEQPPVYQGMPLITALAFSRDGKWLAVGGYREILLHQADGNGLDVRLIGLSQRIQSLAFSPDGKWLAAAGGSPGRFGEIQLWDLATRKLKTSTQFTSDTLFGASWTSDSKRLAFGGADKGTRIIDPFEGKTLLRVEHHTDWVMGTIFSTDNANMVTISRDQAVKLVETATGAFIDNVTSITPGALTGGIEALDRDPKQNEVAVGGVDGIPRIYRMFRTRARQIGDDFNLIRAFEKLPGRISAIQYSQDGSLLAVGATGEAAVYQVADGKKVSSVKFVGGVYAVAFHPSNGTFAAGGFDGFVRIAEARTGKVVKEFIPVPYKPQVASK